jgi:hypothetical protein
MNQNAPVHLLLDTDLSKGKIEVTTFHGFQINFGEKGALQQYFLPLPNEYLAYDQDKVACTSPLSLSVDRVSFGSLSLLFLVDVLSQSATSEKASVSDLNSLEHNLNKLLSLLEDVSQYVDEVVVRLKRTFTWKS